MDIHQYESTFNDSATHHHVCGPVIASSLNGDTQHTLTNTLVFTSRSIRLVAMAMVHDQNAKVISKNALCHSTIHSLFNSDHLHQHYYDIIYDHQHHQHSYYYFYHCYDDDNDS